MFFMTLVPFLHPLVSRRRALQLLSSLRRQRRDVDWVQKLGLVAPAGAPASGGILETLGYIVHGDRSNLANSNVADVANSIINMLGTGITIIVICFHRRWPKIRQEGRRRRRLCAGHHRHPRVLSALAHQCRGMVA
jgi:hypothetical protein